MHSPIHRNLAYTTNKYRKQLAAINNLTSFNQRAHLIKEFGFIVPASPPGVLYRPKTEFKDTLYNFIAIDIQF